MPDSITAEAGETVELPAVPAKTGYSGHWEVDGRTVTSVTVDGDITVTAVYTAKSYTITFVVEEDMGSYESVQADYGTVYTLPELTEKQGYVRHWEVNGKTVTSVTVDGDITVTAVYDPMKYSVTFEYSLSDQGSVRQMNGEFPSGLEVEYGASLSAFITANTSKPDILGYEFTGWTYYGNGVTENGTVFGEDIVALANYERNAYIVTFHFLDGSTTYSTAGFTGNGGDYVDLPSTSNTWTQNGQVVYDSEDPDNSYSRLWVNEDTDVYEALRS